jgi:NAD(P)-dependent dehydrogenase (short-subunit alcohol dehydrogenase family)
MEKSVLITGASTGIGKACALYLTRKGFSVFAGVRRPADGVALQQEEPAITPVIVDVTDANSIQQATKVFGDAPLHGLVNNAGISIAGPLEFLPIEEFRRQLEVNVVGQLAVTQAFMPNIRNARGRIVFVGSVSGLVAAPILGPYAASKHAVEALADSMRVELAPSGIHVSLLEPGDIKTPIWDKGIEANKRLFDNLPDQARRLYGAMVETVNKIAVKLGQQGHPPVKVAEAVHHALTARHPKTRYRMGKHALSTKLISQFMPDKVRDFFIHQGLKRKQR